MSLWGDISKGWGDIKKGAEDVASPIPFVSDVTDLALGGKIPGGVVGGLMGLAPFGGTVADLLGGSGGGGSNPNSAYNIATKDIKGLNTGEANQPTEQELQQYAGLIQNMTLPNAAKFLKALSGTTLGANLQSASTGESIPNIISADQTAANPTSTNQLDPLSAALQGAIQNILPGIVNTASAQNSKAITGLSNDMASALKGASPAMQSALQGQSSALDYANQLMNTSAAESVATAPEWDSLVTNLQSLSNNYKLAQAAAGAIPYWSAVEGTGTIPTAGSSGSGATIAESLAQQASMSNALSQQPAG